LFHELAAQPDPDGLVPVGCDDQSRLVPHRSRALARDRRLELGSARPRLRCSGRAQSRRFRARHTRALATTGADVTDTLSVARGVSWRVLHAFYTNPAFLLPSLAFPLFFFTAFAGGLSRVS